MSRADRNGFTLIEMMVALAVFSLAALALLRLEGSTLGSTAILRNRMIGQIVARNVAVELLTDPVAPPDGVRAGQETDVGRSWRWARTVATIQGSQVKRIDIGVTDDRGQPAGALTVFRSIL